MPEWKEEVREKLANLNLEPMREAAIVDELSQHLEDSYQELLSVGISEAEACQLALTELAENDLLERELRRVTRTTISEPTVTASTGGNILASVLQDVRYAVRTLNKTPGFTAVAVITLALGIGANTAIFSMVNALLLRPLPFSEPDNLVQVWEANVKRGRSEMPASFPNFADWRDQNHVFEQVVAYTDYSFNLTGTSESERIRSALVSPSFFSTLGISPILGRVFLPEEDQKNKVLSVVMGQRLWQRRFNSDPNIVGKAINLNGDSFTVVGVVAQNAHLPLLPADIELWVPVSHGFGFAERGAHYLQVLAR